MNQGNISSTWQQQPLFFEELDIIGRKNVSSDMVASNSEIFSSIFWPPVTTRTESHTKIRAYSDIEKYSNKVNQYGKVLMEKVIQTDYRSFCFQIEGFRRKKRNWGKQGAKNPSNETLDFAYEVLQKLIWLADVKRRRLPEPSVGRCSDGTILFEWNLTDRSFELQFLIEDNTPQYSYLLCPIEKDESTWDEGDFSDSLAKQFVVKEFISWLK